MNTFQFYLTEMGFVSLILIILSLVFTIYLLRVKTKSRSSWLLIGFFFTVIANSLTMLIANGWFFWGDKPDARSRRLDPAGWRPTWSNLPTISLITIKNVKPGLYL